MRHLCFLLIVLLGATPCLAARNLKMPPPEKKPEFYKLYKDCVEIGVLADRLACYDSIAVKMGFMSPDDLAKQKAIGIKYGLWRVIEGVDGLESSIVLKLNSVNGIESQSGINSHPALTLKCQAKKTDIYVDWDFTLNHRETVTKIPVGLSIDDGTQVAEEWSLSSDNFAAYSQDPARLIRAMRGHRKLSLVMTPEGENTASLAYDLTGFDDVLRILIKTCYGENSPAP